MTELSMNVKSNSLLRKAWTGLSWSASVSLWGSETSDKSRGGVCSSGGVYGSGVLEGIISGVVFIFYDLGHHLRREDAGVQTQE